MRRESTDATRPAQLDLWHAIFGASHILLLASIALSIADALIQLAFARILKLVLDAAQLRSEAALISALQLIVFVLAAEFIAMWAQRSAKPAYLRRSIEHFRASAFRALLDKGIGAFDQGGSSRYESALTNDTTQIETSYLEKIPAAAADAVLLVGALILLFCQNTLLAAVAVISALVPLAIGLVSGKRLAGRQRAVSDETERFVSGTHDLISGFPLIKSSGAEAPAEERFGALSGRLEDAKRLRRRTELAVAALSSATRSVSQLSVLLVGSWIAVSDGTLTVGDVLMATQLMNYIAQPFEELPQILAARRASQGLVAKLEEALSQDQGRSGGHELSPTLASGIELDDVQFSYDKEHPILKGVTASLPRGGSYALVGASGSGKSTLLSLLMGAHADYAGSIRFDGLELKDISLESLYRSTSLVRQNTFLFDATIRENITMFGKDDDESIMGAVERAGLGPFVAAHGLDYPCGEAGSNLSGGERQRVCIARSLLHGSDVLLFDEATSALDQKTAHLITDSVLALEGTTRIMVTHRLDADELSRFDRILVLRDGKISEEGTFQELMGRHDGYFRALYTVGA
jgi:ABC-type multidrug transport system fused ATPase/permease subunit